MLYNTRIRFKGSQYAEYMKDSGEKDEENEDSSLLYLVNKENEKIDEAFDQDMKDQKGPKSKNNILKDLKDSLIMKTKTHFLLPIKIYLRPQQFIQHSKRASLKEAINQSERGKMILMILIFILLITLFFDKILSTSLSLSFGIGVLTFSFYYSTKIVKYRQKLISVLSFPESITPNQIEGLIVKILKFLREFEIINRGQRIGITKNLTIEANEPELEFNSITEKIHYDAAQFIDLRKAAKISSVSCKDILLRILNILNHDKFISLTKLEQRNQKNLLSSKAIHETYETFIVLKKEVQHEFKLFIEQIFSNNVSKNQIDNLSNLILEYNKNEAREYNTLSASFELNKNRYKDHSSDQSLVQAKLDFRKIFEIKHLQDLIVMQNNYKTLKRKNQSVILNLRTAADNNKEGYSQEAIQNLLEQLEEVANLELELTSWHRAIYEKIITDFQEKLQKFILVNKSNEDPNQTFEKEMPNQREAIHHDDENEGLQNERISKAVGIFEVEPNLELLPNSENMSRKSDQSTQLVNMNMNTVIDELKDLLPQKKKPYTMKFFKQDKTGTFKEEAYEASLKATPPTIQDELSNEQNSQNSKDRVQDVYKFEQSMMPLDFRFDLANELRNRKILKKKKEEDDDPSQEKFE